MVAALLARSQARVQVQADQRKSLREPRKIAYVAFAECWNKRYRLAEVGRVKLHMALRVPQAREELLAEVAAHRSAAMDLTTELEHLCAVVLVEGPAAVTSAAIEASATGFAQFNALNDALRLFMSPNAPDGGLNDYDAKQHEAYKAYRAFLSEASDALSVDWLARQP
ncbi:hypothetical protein ADK52_27400 [Streptomyces sp. WM6372]|nr:hypothetical protein ADK52_27400 [Streptomyces sp. WM6372]